MFKSQKILTLLANLDSEVKKLNKQVFSKDEQLQKTDPFWGYPLISNQKTLAGLLSELREHFEELDERFDLLCEYLGVGYFEKKETQEQGHRVKKSFKKGFRKLPKKK